MKEPIYPRNYQVTSRLRLRGYDYTNSGQYFVTGVSANRAPIFGRVEHSMFRPSPMGSILIEEWHKLESSCPTVVVDCFQVMPDHFHGILTLLPDGGEKPLSLSAVIGRFKSLPSRRYWALRDSGQCEDVGTTCWQNRFHDRIIRSNRQYDELILYMALNPHRWTQRLESS